MHTIWSMLPTPVKDLLRGSHTVRRIAYWLSGNRVVTIQSGPGKGLQIDLWRGSANYQSGTNELPVQTALAEQIKPGSVFYDVGANIGFFTIIGRRLVTSAGRVVAFEAVPENAQVVERNCALNGFEDVQVVAKAVSNAGGSGTLVLSSHDGGAALQDSTDQAGTTETIVVELVSLDDFVAQHPALAPNLVKIDVEGAELLVLQGMAKVLAEFRPIIIFELDDETADGLKRKLDACTQYLEAANYTISDLPDSYNQLAWHVRHFLALPRQ